jgi:hypothetical protein
MTDLKVIEGGASNGTSPATKKRRRRTPNSTTGCPIECPVDIIDALNNLVRSAQGIELAVMG